MCGIAGIVRKREDGEPTSELHRMVETLRHRGPDDHGEVTFTVDPWAIGLGSTRLAILDLSAAGHQPMEDESGRRYIVYNGEIYNYRELREELNGTCGQWRSKTDTEVILKGYAGWGKGCLERFRGMFAFALWDDNTKQLILVRDPLGIKPLYYSVAGDLLVFASEVRTILDSGLVPRRLSPEGLVSYLSFGTIETPFTILQGIHSLPGGHLLIADLRKEEIEVRVEQYHDTSFPSHNEGFTDRMGSAHILRDELEKSVRAHLVSDVPVGAFLSGGIDSSAVVALMSHVSKEKPRTFSVVFSEKGFSEAPYARRIAGVYGTEHTEISLAEGDLLDMLPSSLLAMDQPTIDGVNTYVVSQAVRTSGITVALSGLGGDELFGGYPTFARARLARYLKMVPRNLRGGIARAFRGIKAGSRWMTKAIDALDSELSPREIYLLSRRLFRRGEIENFFPTLPKERPKDHLPTVPQNIDPFLSISLYEMGHYMMNMLLRDTDCMSMAHGLEVRVPFVDREVIRTVLSIPSAHKTDGRRPKSLLLDAVGDLLPEEVWKRPKMGFNLPFERWMRGCLASELEMVFSKSDFFKALGLDSRAVLEVWQRFQGAPYRVGWSRPWALYVLARWAELHRITA
jgi:asparagine synthase (glutamine-hydrolysing)